MKKMIALLLAMMVFMTSYAALATSAPAAGEVMGLQEAIAEKPILMTSAGQSADVQMLYAIMSKMGIEAEIRAVAEADQLELEAYKTLIIAVGGSSKGLGAAGIDEDEEMTRVMNIIEKYKETCTIIVAHIGGDARRGTLSDKFINAVVPFAQYIVVVEGGNTDGLFTAAAQQYNIPLDEVTNIMDVGNLMVKAFKTAETEGI